MIKKLSRIFLAVMALALVMPPSSLYATDNSNLIDDFVYDKVGSMSQADIQNFINHFNGQNGTTLSCLNPSRYPSGLSPVTFKEPLSYYDYGGDVSPARIIWKAANLYGINPQVILATLEKEQSLVSGSASVGCPLWKYNSSMGYNCPDGSENNLKNYPSIGVYNTCVAKESNVTFSRQVNHASWQLAFDRNRAYGNVNWSEASEPNPSVNWNTYYGGRMTEGYRKRSINDNLVYYEGTTVIDGQVIKLANGATAALYNYTPHINSFNSIFTRWFGNAHGSRWTSLMDPRVLVTSRATYKINPDSGEQLQSVPAGAQIAFPTKTTFMDGSGCLRTRLDTKNNANQCIKYEDLSEFTPTITSINTDNSVAVKQTAQWTCKVNYRTLDATNQCFDASTHLNLLKKTTVAGVNYLITKVDSDNGNPTAFLASRIVDIPQDTPASPLPTNERQQKSLTWTCKIDLSTKAVVQSQCYDENTVINFSKTSTIDGVKYLITNYDDTHGINTAFLAKRFVVVE